jgi:hypothetical protein
MTATTIATAEATASTLRAFDSFMEAKRLAKQAEALKAEAETALRAFMAQHGVEAITVEGRTVVTLAKRNRTGVDTALLKSAFPEAFEATQTATAYDFLRTAGVTE